MTLELTIEQLAAETGMTVRNIRAHQARGLLDPPVVRQRVGYYGPEHVAQLKLIRDLQEDGFNLAGIKRLLDDAMIEESPQRPDFSLDDQRRRYYRLTKFGKAVAEAEAERMERVLALARLKNVLGPQNA